ncbi:MAG: sulfite exporter TauE/SafE family protein [Pseudomonadota bacterium]|nr:sulfite exporter TauE/SafE family protein [Pseudomonadota bacterium]
MWSLEIIALIAAAFFFGGLVKGVTGLGVPVIVLACLATTIGLKEAMALLVVPAFVTNVWQAVAGPDFPGIFRRLSGLLLASVLGIWAGVSLLASAQTRLLVGVLGAILFVYSLFSLLRPQIAPPGPRREIWLSPTVGVLSGFLFGLTGSYMVPGVVYVQALGLSRDGFVQALGIVFCTIMFVLGISMSRYDMMTTDLALASAACLAPITVGMLAGQRLRHLMPEQAFRNSLFASLCVVGIYMIVRAAV